MEENTKLDECITKWALKNAVDYNLAIPGKVIGKVFVEFPELKGDAKDLMKKIHTECMRINNMNADQVKEEIANHTFAEKKKQVEKGIVLPDAIDGQVVTRFPPEPSGFLHIGHAKAAYLNFEGAKNHNGKMRLRIDDTNPAKAKQEFVDAVMDGLKWLGVEYVEPVTYSSDYMEKFYELADELILKNKAYVCTCSQDEIKLGREKRERCTCSARMSEENVIEFRKMSDDGYDVGKAILRYKGDMKSENSVMRDPTLLE